MKLIKSGILFFSDKRSIDLLIVLNVLVAPGHRNQSISPLLPAGLGSFTKHV